VVILLSGRVPEELLDPPDLGATTAADRDVFLEN
jgi:hypothetical protein